MVRRKDRVTVVLDTNVLIAFYLSTSPASANAKVYRLWRDRRRLQLILSDETEAEYFEVLGRLGVSRPRLDRLREILRWGVVVTRVSLGKRPVESRDPDDNLVLATALAGKVKYLITNDRDLLDIPDPAKKKFKFKIITPAEFLSEVAG